MLLAATLRWCAICQPVHGSAGCAFVFENDQKSEYTQQLFKRFPGFDFQDGGWFALEARDVHNRIKCVNWLTVLCDALVEELGGRDKMHTTLEPVCKAHDYPGGVVIQA
ncbi:type VI immunity family protein, partial [Herbaspirillum huttiense]|uniref:type VI immunity family protein n=1 Tax=Herbaspirillum huttiense TaxID=863372 RepID=UPI001E4ADF4E